MSLSKINFKDFLLNEAKYYLAERIGSILSAIQDLLQNFEGIGKRQLIFNCENIISQIRSILQDKWSEKEKNYLLEIQKAGVALAKCLNEKGEMREVLESVSEVFSKISEKLGVPVNSIGNESEEDISKESPKESPKENQDTSNDDVKGQ
jgi:N-glycosylase/DNA lyase